MAQATSELWSLGGIPMSVERDSEDEKLIRLGKRSVLDSSKTTLHFGGTEAYDRDITAVMWNYSGYVNTFMPIIGTGYHALVSDEGGQGNYFIHSCKAERIQDFIQCEGNNPVRITMQLKRETDPLAPVWPGTIYFCAAGTGAGTDNGGVWKTDSFGGPDLATDPTWSKLSVTGSWPADNYLRSFGIDVSDSDEYVYALTGSVWGSDVIRYTDTAGTWDTILSAATIALDGVTAWDFMVDPVTGYLFCLAISNNLGADHFHIYRCTDGTAGVPVWTSVFNNPGWRRGQGHLWVYDDVAMYAWTSGLTKYYHVASISTGGGSLVHTNLIQTGNNNVAAYLALGTQVYHTYATSNTMRRWAVGGAAESSVPVLATAAQIAAYNRSTVPIRFMPTGASSLRYVGNVAPYAGHLFTTEDQFTTYIDQGVLNTGGITINQIVEFVNSQDYDMIIYGGNGVSSSYPDGIFVGYGSTDLALDGRAGANAGASPYTDSIPYTAGGPCRRGIQVPNYTEVA